MVRLISIFLTLLILASCHAPKPHVIEDESKLPKQVAGSSDAQIRRLEQKLEYQGVKIIIIGQMHLISVPSYLVFEDQTPTIKWKSYALLNDLAEYLCKFRKIAMEVNAHNDCYKSEKRTKHLTAERAKVVADYLWTQNVRTRLLFTHGLGNEKPIVMRTKCSDLSPNSRLEIIFREMIE